MEWVLPEWPAPPGVRALTTTRQGGHSLGPYASLNLAAHVGDDPGRAAPKVRAMPVNACDSFEREVDTDDEAGPPATAAT